MQSPGSDVKSMTIYRAKKRLVAKVLLANRRNLPTSLRGCKGMGDSKGAAVAGPDNLSPRRKYAFLDQASLLQLRATRRRGYNIILCMIDQSRAEVFSNALILKTIQR